jgi:uncharacterized protein YdhG (YjbR/CyaY superfamily)
MKKAASKSVDKKCGPAKNVDAYLAAIPHDKRIVLEKLRKTIKAAAPKAEEGISYQMPAFKYLGPLVYFAAFKNHCSFFVGSKSILKTFGKELKAYEATGATIHFSVEKPLPAALVKKIVKARMRENEEKLEARGQGLGAR